MDNGTKLRIGILGTSRIARKNIKAIENPASDCVVSAIASRSLERLEPYVRQHCQNHEEVHLFYNEGAYQSLIDSCFCDVVYIPLPTSLKKQWVLKSLAAGKHVLVEKPVSLTFDDYLEIKEMSMRNRRVILDGTMFVHNPRFKQFLECVTNESLFGEVRRINSSFTFCGDEEFFKSDIRVFKDGDPLGCIGDLGWYCIRSAVLLYCQHQGLAPTSAQVIHYSLTDSYVPIDAQCLVEFGEKILSFHCSFQHTLGQRLELVGQKQSAEISDFVIPVKDSNSFFVFQRGFKDMDCYGEEIIQIIECPRSPAQETLMWHNLNRYTKSGDMSDDNSEAYQYLLTSMETQRIVQALMDSLDQGGTKIPIK